VCQCLHSQWHRLHPGCLSAAHSKARISKLPSNHLTPTLDVFLQWRAAVEARMDELMEQKREREGDEAKARAHARPRPKEQEVAMRLL